MPSKIRIAVVGVGHLGKHHVRLLAENPIAELVGVADIDEQRLQEVTTAHGVTGFRDYKDLIGKVDAACVVVPTQAHLEVAGCLLESGVDVLVEKPIAPTAADGQKLVELAQNTGRILQVGHVERFNPAVVALRDHHIEPRYIDASRVAPFSFRSADVGVVLDLMIHDIDIVLSLAGSRPVRVEAAGVAVLTACEDIANARVVFENGCVASLTASRVATKTERKIRVFSHDSYLTVDFDKRQGVLYRKSPELTVERVQSLAAGAENLADLRGMVFSNLLQVEHLPVQSEDALTEEIRSFVACVRDRDRTGHQHLRRSVHRLGGGRVPARHARAGAAHAVRHPLPRADGSGPHQGQGEERALRGPRVG